MDLELRREHINRMLLECKQQVCNHTPACICFLCSTHIVTPCNQCNSECCRCHFNAQNSSPLKGPGNADFERGDKRKVETQYSPVARGPQQSNECYHLHHNCSEKLIEVRKNLISAGKIDKTPLKRVSDDLNPNMDKG
jgi:hypothetical protein